MCNIKLVWQDTGLGSETYTSAGVAAQIGGCGRCGLPLVLYYTLCAYSWSYLLSQLCAGDRYSYCNGTYVLLQSLKAPTYPCSGLTESNPVVVHSGVSSSSVRAWYLFNSICSSSLLCRILYSSVLGSWMVQKICRRIVCSKIMSDVATVVTSACVASAASVPPLCPRNTTINTRAFKCKL